MHDEIAAAADLFGLASYKNVYSISPVDSVVLLSSLRF